jgi:hypothetical protein
MDRINTGLTRDIEICRRVTVMNKDWRELACHIVPDVVTIRHLPCGDRRDDVEVVAGGDGQVPHPAGGDRRGVAAEGHGRGAGRGAQVGAVLERADLDPAARCGSQNRWHADLLPIPRDLIRAILPPSALTHTGRLTADLPYGGRYASRSAK